MSKQGGLKDGPGQIIASQERPWWIGTLGESGSAIWLMESRWILNLLSPRVQSRRAWSSRRNAPGSSVSCRTLVSGKFDRRLVGVFFRWSSCIRCWGRLDETAVSRVHFWLARAPSQARGCCRALLSAPGVDDDGQNVTLTACRHHSPGRLCIFPPEAACLWPS
jgi:hypothetical protein